MEITIDLDTYIKVANTINGEITKEKVDAKVNDILKEYVDNINNKEQEEQLPF